MLSRRHADLGLVRAVMFSRRALGSCRTIPKVHRVHGFARRLATVAEPPPAASESTLTGPPPGKTTPQKTADTNARVHAAVVLNRHPILSRTPTPFERAYYSYHSRIQRALYNPFPSEFYFKPGSLLQGKFEEEELQREKEAFGPMPWLESSTSKKATPTSDVLNQEDAVVVMPRESEADKKGDVKSLDRMGERNLYLLVLDKSKGKGVWRFPQTKLADEELLHEAVKRELRSPYSTNMDTWVVSRIPMGVYQPKPLITPSAEETHVFFFKAHILQGQVHPDGKQIADFAWLTKQEIQSRVEQDYWDGVKDILSDF